MRICTTRFGTVDIDPEAVLFFPAGLIGYEECRQWVLLPDMHSDGAGWLQSLNQPDLAVAVVSPRRVVPEYRVRLSSGDLETLQLNQSDQAYVLTIVGCNDRALTLNLRAPLIVNLDRQLGHQVITLDNQPLQYEFAERTVQVRQTA